MDGENVTSESELGVSEESETQLITSEGDAESEQPLIPDDEPNKEKLEALRKARMKLAESGVADTGAPQDRRGDVSASTIAKMMGLITSKEFQVLEGKIDLSLNRINNIQAKMEKIQSSFASLPTGHDLERIDVQLAALRTLIKDTLAKSLGEADEAANQSRKIRSSIVSTESNEKLKA